MGIKKVVTNCQYSVAPWKNTRPHYRPAFLDDVTSQVSSQHCWGWFVRGWSRSAGFMLIKNKIVVESTQ